MGKPTQWERLLELVNPMTKEAQAWDKRALLKAVPSETSTQTWKRVQDFVLRLMEVAAKGPNPVQPELDLLQQTGSKALGRGTFGRVFMYKPEGSAPLAVKVGSKWSLQPDLAYSQDVKGIPPVLKQYVSEGAKNEQGIVMPFIPGTHRTRQPSKVGDIDLPGGEANLDVLNTWAEAMNKGLHASDMHGRNISKTPPVSSGIFEPNRGWMIDRGGVFPVPTEIQTSRRRGMADEIVRYIDRPDRHTEIRDYTQDVEMFINLLKQKGSEKRWPELFELLYEAPETRRFLP